MIGGNTCYACYYSSKSCELTQGFQDYHLFAMQRTDVWLLQLMLDYLRDYKREHGRNISKINLKLHFSFVKSTTSIQEFAVFCDIQKYTYSTGTGILQVICARGKDVAGYETRLELCTRITAQLSSY